MNISTSYLDSQDYLKSATTKNPRRPVREVGMKHEMTLALPLDPVLSNERNKKQLGLGTELEHNSHTNVSELTVHPTKSKSCCELENLPSNMSSLNLFVPVDSGKLKADPISRIDDPCLSSFPSSLATFFKYHDRPASIRSSKVHWYEPFRSKVLLQFGPVLFGCWDWKYGRPILQATNDQGYGVAFTIFSSFGKVNFFLYRRRDLWTLRQWSLSLQWNLSFEIPVRNDSQVMQLARRGDIRGLQRLFQQGKGRVSDVSIDGTTLLHVCIPLKAPLSSGTSSY